MFSPQSLGVDECSPVFHSLNAWKRESTAINPRTRVFHMARRSFAFDSCKVKLNDVSSVFQTIASSVVSASPRALVSPGVEDSTVRVSFQFDTTVFTARREVHSSSEISPAANARS
jgi:hypothetical protein